MNKLTNMISECLNIKPDYSQFSSDEKHIFFKYAMNLEINLVKTCAELVGKDFEAIKKALKEIQKDGEKDRDLRYLGYTAASAYTHLSNDIKNKNINSLEKLFAYWTLHCM